MLSAAACRSTHELDLPRLIVLSPSLTPSDGFVVGEGVVGVVAVGDWSCGLTGDAAGGRDIEPKRGGVSLPCIIEM